MIARHHESEFFNEKVQKMRTKFIFPAGILAIAVSIGVANASQLFVYPKNGQSAEQKDRDEYDCYKWAKENSGVNPNAPAQTAKPGERAGAVIGGGAKGAALGAGMGAIAGNAGKGAAMGAVGGAVVGRRQRLMNEKMEHSMTTHTYHRAFAACMEGRGYTVK